MLTQLLKILDDMKAIDVKIMDVRKQTTITDYMIIASGRSSRHVKATAQTLVEEMKHSGFPALHSTGFESCDWILIDFGDIIVHVMQAESRQYYNLEGLWEESNPS